MRLLFVHAHPDDESLWNGASIAHHVAAGDEVYVLTCTLGEEGEVIPEALKHLELPAGQPRDPSAPDPLAPVRREELREAMRRSGVAGSSVLGEDGGPRWRDSGMAGTPSFEHPRAFAAADPEDVGAAIREHIEKVAPDAVVTYDEHGGYGHPDHIQTHRGTVAAVRGMTERPALYAKVIPRSWYGEDVAWLGEQLTPERRAEWHAAPPPSDDAAQMAVRDDAVPTHEVVDPQVVPAQQDAIAAHETQVRTLPQMYVLSNEVASRISGREAFVRLDPDTGTEIAGSGEPRRALGS